MCPLKDKSSINIDLPSNTFQSFPHTKADKPQFIINIDTPDGTSLDQTDRVAQYVDSVLTGEEEIEHYAINIGHGNPRIYYNVIPKNNSATHGQFFIP